MKVLMFCSNPINGGTPRVFVELTAAMRRRKPNWEVLACVNERNPAEIYEQVPNLIRLPIESEELVCEGMYASEKNLFERLRLRVLRKIKYAPVRKSNIEVMENYLSREKIKCVVIHNGGYVGDDLCNQMLEASMRAQIPGRIFVLHNCSGSEDITFQWRFRLYDKMVSRCASEIVTVSEFTSNRIRKVSSIRRKIRVIPNGLPDICLVSADQAARTLQLPDKPGGIVMIGNFLSNKGHIEFLQAAQLTAKANPNAWFAIIGNVYDESYYQECLSFLQKTDLSHRVFIRSGIHNAAKYLSLFEMLVAPSLKNESFGLISLEAKRASLPVVAFSCEGIPEVVRHGQDGFLVPVRDTSSLAEHMMKLLANTELRKQMGDLGRKDYVHRFTVDEMSEKYERLVFGDE